MKQERRENVKERVKKLRKELGLTLEKFGEKLGVGKNAISRIETGKSNLTDQMLKAICNVNWDGRYVNENWLRDGAGEMFKTDPHNELKALANKYQMSSTEYAFLKEFFKLEPSRREDFFQTLDKVFSAVHAGGNLELATPNSEANSTTNSLDKSIDKLSDEEIGKLYRQGKQVEREAREKSEVS